MTDVQLKTALRCNSTSRVSVSKRKTWKTQTLKTCCVTTEHCPALCLEPLLFIVYSYKDSL